MSPAIYFVLVVVINGAWTKQQFDAMPSATEVNPGDRTQLTCRIQNRRGMCSWLKDGQIKGLIENKYEFVPMAPNGDCSLRISNAVLEHDDGMWQCQVAQASLDEMPLSSQMVRLTVRHAPQLPFIEHNPNNISNAVRLSNNDPIDTAADVDMFLSCISQQGNPPATLQWFLDHEDITNKARQRNDSDQDMAKTWRAKSSLNFPFQREHNGKMLKCIANHPLMTKEVVVSVNVRYKPTVQFSERPPGDVQENQNVRMSCVAEANPKATIHWRTPQRGIKIKDTLEFSQISREDGGSYSCWASNDLGDSEHLEVNLDVKYPPKIVSVEPKTKITVQLYESVRLACRAEGNPLPRYAWLQSVDGKPNMWQHRGSDAVLNIQNVTYGFQGKYLCEASNVIAQKEHKEQSFTIDLDIVGPPQAMRDSRELVPSVVFEKDEDAAINVIFCADPPPLEIYWEWGSVRMELGTTHERYTAKHLLKDELPEDCYQARLQIQKAESGDSRSYTLNVRNDKGLLAQAVELRVQEPVTMSAVIGIVIGCILVLVIVVVVIFYLLKKEKCLLLRAKGFKPDASENSSRRLSEELTNGYPQKDRAIPPDALYTDVQEGYQQESPSPQLRQRQSEGSIVYADLDLSSLQAERSQGKPTKPQPRERIEYAEIQFKPSTHRVDV